MLFRLNRRVETRRKLVVGLEEFDVDDLVEEVVRRNRRLAFPLGLAMLQRHLLEFEC